MTFSSRFYRKSPTAFCISRGHASNGHYCLQATYRALIVLTVSWFNELYALVTWYIDIPEIGS